MSIKFLVQSSDRTLLEKARHVGEDFVRKYKTEQVVGIVFLGAVARGYFDRSADIDIAIFKKRGSDLGLHDKFFHVEGFEVQVWLSDYEDDVEAQWDMSRRWTYSQAEVYFDPKGKIAELIGEKVPLKEDERKWLMMSGISMSEWYVSRLTQLWVERGNMTSAHQMVDQGIIYFFDMLFGLNHELVADMKWRNYCVERLERLPAGFSETLREAMILREFTLKELERRKRAFMGMWEEMRPLVEAEVGLSYEEINNLV